MTKSTKQILIEARGLIDSPSRWIKNQNNKGECFCAFGAVCRAARKFGPYKWQQGEQALNKQTRSLYGKNIFEYNDHPDTTHTDIMNLFDKAIQAAE